MCSVQLSSCPPGVCLFPARYALMQTACLSKRAHYPYELCSHVSLIAVLIVTERAPSFSSWRASCIQYCCSPHTQILLRLDTGESRSFCAYASSKHPDKYSVVATEEPHHLRALAILFTSRFKDFLLFAVFN